MSSLRQHFQRIKELVDWSWTLALLCLFGYITLGQLAQLYWAMVVLGGVAGSFGLFYEFSCQKLAELDSLDTYELQKATASAYQAEILLNQFTKRNPRVTSQSINFVQARQQVNKVRAISSTTFQQKINNQRQAAQQKQAQPSQQKPAPPKQTPEQGAVQSKRQYPVSKLPTKVTKSRLTQAEYSRISNQSDYVPVRGHFRRNGAWVEPHYRRKPRR